MISLALYFSNISNFGDQLNVALLNHYGFSALESSSEQADLACIGSVLGWINEDAFSGVVLGAGLVSYDQQFHCLSADVRVIRGPLSLARSNIRTKPIFGDYGLLASDIVRKKSEKSLRKKYFTKNKALLRHEKKCSSRTTRSFFVEHRKVALVPHYVDWENPLLNELLEQNEDMFVVDVRETPRTVLANLSTASLVISSSLHGLVAADSYGIPSIWITFDGPIIGGDFKFIDYFQGIDGARERIHAKDIMKSGIQENIHYPDCASIERKKDELRCILRKSLAILIAKKSKRFINRHRINLQHNL